MVLRVDVGKFRQIFLVFDSLFVFVLCPFLLGVLEIAVYECHVVYLICNLYLWIVDIFNWVTINSSDAFC